MLPIVMGDQRRRNRCTFDFASWRCLFEQRRQAAFQPLNFDVTTAELFVFHHAKMKLARRLDAIHRQLEQCSVHSGDRV